LILSQLFSDNKVREQNLFSGDNTMKARFSTTIFKLIIALIGLSFFTIHAFGQITKEEVAERDYQTGIEKELAGDWKSALGWYQRAVEGQKNNPDYHYKVAFVSKQLGKIDKSLSTLNHIVKNIDKSHKQSYALMGFIYQEQSNDEKALEAFSKAININQNYALPYYGLGKVFERRNEKQKAIEAYQTYLILDSYGDFVTEAEESLRALQLGEVGHKLNLAIAALQNREYERAMKLLEKILQEKPDLQEAHYWRGIIYHTYEAYSYFDPDGEKSEKEWLQAPDIKDARIELGLWYYQIGELDNAHEQLQAALKIDPKCARAHLYLGLVYILQNKREEAINAFKAAQKFDIMGEYSREAAEWERLLGADFDISSISDFITQWPPEQWNLLAQKVIDVHGKQANDPLEQKRLEEILDKILSSSHIQTTGYNYSIMLIENDNIGGWNLPDGHLFVTTGLLQFVKKHLKNDDYNNALAFVIAHEVTHVIDRDVERTTEAKQLITGSFAGKSLNLVSLESSFSRADEVYADKNGALLAYQAKFDPTAALRLWDAMIAVKADIDANGSHPTYQQRKNLLIRYLRQVQMGYGHFRLGVESLKKGEYDVAIEKFKGYLAYFPYDKFALNNLGVAYYQSAFAKYLSMPHAPWRISPGWEEIPGIPPMGTLKGHAEPKFDEEQIRLAITYIERAISEYRAYQTAFRTLADIYQAIDEFDKAFEIYQDALRLNNKSAETHNSLGVLYCRQERFEQGIAEFGQAIKLKSGFKEAQYNLALAYEQMGQKEKAKAEWKKYLLLPGDDAVWVEKAQGHLNQLIEE
jgi:tetratricopeptide (TPR) repeat protein